MTIWAHGKRVCNRTIIAAEITRGKTFKPDIYTARRMFRGEKVRAAKKKNMLQKVRAVKRPRDNKKTVGEKPLDEIT